MLRAARRRARHWRGSIDRSPKLLVLMYHRVLPEVQQNPLDTIVSQRTFVRQLDAITRLFPVITMEDALTQQATDEVRSPVQVVLTFDDGYADNASVVLPELQQRRLPAMFYIATESIDSGAPMWDWQLVTSILGNPAQRSIPLNGQHMTQRNHESRLQFAYRVLDHAKQTSRAAHAAAMASCGESPAMRGVHDRCMTWQEVRLLAKAEMEIGAHSMTHRSLAKLPVAEAIHEIQGSKRIIEEQLQQTCDHFAFPFGSQCDFNDALITQVAAAGFRSCALNIHGYNRWPGDSMQLRRIIMSEHTNTSCLLG